MKSILAEYKIHNADVTLRSDATADDLIDVVEGNRYCVRAWKSCWVACLHLNYKKAILQSLFPIQAKILIAVSLVLVSYPLSDGFSYESRRK